MTDWLIRCRAPLLVLAGLLLATVPARAPAQSAPAQSAPVPAAPVPVACPAAGAPTVDITDAFAQRGRMAQLDSAAPRQSLTIRRASFERKVQFCPAAAAATHAAPPAGVRLLPVRVRSLYNSAYPLNVNNGAVWAGAGVSATVEGGFDLAWGPLRAAVYPLVAWQQNADFLLREVELPGSSPFIYGGHPGRIDWPQRHGTEPFWTLHPGQSSLWLEAAGLAVGVSTENLWIGPAQRNPLMMSNSAPGFPHLFFATARPLQTPIGGFEGQAFWGRLQESDHFDSDPDNDRSVLVGTSLTWEPSFLRGLFLGAHRSWIVPVGKYDRTLIDYFIDPFVDLRGNPGFDNKLFSIFGRWVMPAARFELYGEWGREDGWGEWVDFLRELDHSQTYVLGLQKLSGSAGRTFRWWTEVANLQHAAPVRGGRWILTPYVHAEITQGYTHRGQLLGAWIGPGSVSQILGMDYLRGGRSTGLAIERVRFDADAYYSQWARFYGETGHDAAIALWLRHSEVIGSGLHAAATTSIARRQNRHFTRFTGEQPADLQWETNAHLDLEVRWTPRR